MIGDGPQARLTALRPGSVVLEELGISALSSRLLVVCDGLLTLRVGLRGTPSTEILGPGDLVQIGGDANGVLAFTWSLEVIEASRVAVLDAQLESIVRRSPVTAINLIRNAGDRATRQLLHRTACQLPRVEDRLLAVLWLLAERWGVVTPRGVELPFALPHARLGELVGAARPTVTTAMGLLVGRGDVLQPERQRVLLEPGSHERLGQAGAVKRAA